MIRLNLTSAQTEELISLVERQRAVDERLRDGSWYRDVAADNTGLLVRVLRAQLGANMKRKGL